MFIDNKQEDVPGKRSEMDADFRADESGRAGDEEGHRVDAEMLNAAGALATLEPGAALTGMAGGKC